MKEPEVFEAKPKIVRRFRGIDAAITTPIEELERRVAPCTVTVTANNGGAHTIGPDQSDAGFLE